jgi:hypothetical protein
MQNILQVKDRLGGNHDFGMLTNTHEGEMLKLGSLFVLPANHPRYVWAGDEGAIVHIQFTGPGGITFIDPADDPRKK